MTAFSEAYKNLSTAQRQAVDQIDGPVLVIAGPGTGKTQLLSARVANILDKTDTLPQNILCLTFTENGASNMRERLARFIGQAAYDVNIGTYHAFGGDLIQRFPEYFAQTRLQRAVDDLGKRQIVNSIVEKMAYDNPLKSTRYHLHDLMGTLSEVKRGLLDEKDLRAIATENILFVTNASAQSREVFTGIATMPSSFAKSGPYFERLLLAVRPLVPKNPVNATFGSLASSAVRELQEAWQQAETATSSKPLTAWKNKWLEKDGQNQFIFKGTRENLRIQALADVFMQYQAALEARGLYDFDDMILRSIQALETNDDLRFSLQEQYLYILLDEFQDTNAAQLKLVKLLTDNPMNEGRPNVMAVGDDDQAIYAFQGATYSNMLDFAGLYSNVLLVNLTENYRSHQDILQVAENVATQITARLTTSFQDLSKQLVAANSKLPRAGDITRHEFLSDIGQYDFLAAEIESLIKGGVPASEIAVLAPRHKQLEPLVAYLNQRQIPVRYEKRENILETTVVRQLLTMSKLVIALHANEQGIASALWPQVLSYDFWQMPTADIWQLAWRVRDEKTDWGKELLDSTTFRHVGLLFLELANIVEGERLECMLDYLIGTEALPVRDKTTPLVQSPLRNFYTSSAVRHQDPEIFYDTLSHLTVLRAKLREHEEASDQVLTLPDLLRFVQMYEEAEERMVNVSPYNQQAQAVQLMTVFKAKGLEFQHVFLPSCQDEVWGDSSRGNSNRLTLPANLSPIRHAGATADERLRIFFVAVTRAKIGLHLTSFLNTYSGKASKRLKYLNEQEQSDGSIISNILPENLRRVRHGDSEAPALDTLEYNWQSRHLQGLHNQQLRDLLTHRLENYRLNASNLNTFTDMVHGGPESFLLNSLLRFPQAASPAAAYGIAIHTTLQELQTQINAGKDPRTGQLIEYFERLMRGSKLPPDEIERLVARGQSALTVYVLARLNSFIAGNKPEPDFWAENVMLDGVIRLSGKLDRLDINKADHTLTIVDYKTGKPFSSWIKSEEKLHKYRRQLYFYKLLVEHSRTWRGWTVAGGQLEFVEPDEQGVVHTLELQYNQAESQETEALIRAVWNKIQSLDLPDVTQYATSLSGTRQFEADLLTGL